MEKRKNTGPNRLSPRQEQFCLLYLKLNNATEAYQLSYKTPNRLHCNRGGYRLLRCPKIQKFLKEQKEEFLKKHKIELDDLIALNKEIAFSKLSNVVELKNGEIFFKDKANLDELDSLGFSVATQESHTSKGSFKSSSRSITVKRPDRVKAAQELAKLTGAYNDNGESDRDAKKATSQRILDSIAKFIKK